MLCINKMLHWWTQCNVRSVMFMLYFSPVPDHLRTKYEPEVEDKESVLSATACRVNQHRYTEVYELIPNSQTLFLYLLFSAYFRDKLLTLMQLFLTWLR
jgi:hypothetical protein